MGGMGGGDGGGGFSFPMGGMGGMGSMGGMHGMGGMGRRKPKQSAPVQHNLYCSLEELYNGTAKKMRVTRKRLNADGQTTHDEEKILEIRVKKGWKAGTKITFEKEGDELPDVIPADIQFVLEEKPHSRFKREGNDLVYRHRVKLKDALLGTRVEVLTLDERRLAIPINRVISPNYTHRVSGEGMPISKTNGEKKGDLLITFDIEFPNQLTEKQKQAISEAF